MKKLTCFCLIFLILLTTACGRNASSAPAECPVSHTEQSFADVSAEGSSQVLEESESQAEPSDADASIDTSVDMSTEESTRPSEESEPQPEEFTQPPEESTPEPDPDPADPPESSTVACPSVNGALHVEGTRLVDQTGTPVQLRGVSTHGLAWFPDYVNLNCFRQLRQEWNVNVVRLAMYTAEYGGYCSGGDREALKALVDQGVRFAAEADMYVIIDWHILSDNNPNLHREEARAFFRELSARYAGLDHVIYEICNEPNGGTTWQDVKTYAVDIIGEIRKNDPDAVILVGTPNWSQYVDLAAADPIRGYENLMYTLHFYAATHKDDLRNRLVKAVNSGLPVFVSEYGICDASGNGALDIGQANTWIDLLDQYGISHIAWNLSNKDESSSILRPNCGKTAGFTAEDLSACGQWLYRMLTGTTPLDPPREEADHTDGSQDPAEPPQNTTESSTDSLGITLTVVNAWNADHAAYRQYDLTLKNTSGADLNGWTVTLPFQESFHLSNSWNGVFSVQGTDLVITSVEYNGTIPAGGTVTDIGFIICIP